MRLIRSLLILVCMHCSAFSKQARETLPALQDGQAPTNFAEMWRGFDPRAEPLEIETLHAWEEDGVVLRIVRFRIGVFKGEQAKLAAVYGYSKDAVASGKKLPGLLQIHGGGQYADHRACLANARRGYATVSIAWAGRISAPAYSVNPAVVKLFWDGKTEDPNYKLTTDWGAVDGYHAPCRNPKNNFPSAQPAAWTLDAVESPRNSPWFLCAVAARRALTFLAAQPEVDAERLGVYGHSMGGKLTVMTSVDPRVKAAAPSCGGISDRDNSSQIYRTTIGDDVSLQKISCPLIFLSPANDFHGRIGDLRTALGEIATDQWRVVCSPHHNHQDHGEFEVTTLLWFDQHLKGSFRYPETPLSSLKLNSKQGVPVFTVTPDPLRPVLSVEVYYTQQGRASEKDADRENTVSRFWRYARPRKSADKWSAELPLLSIDKPLWVYANVSYALEKPVSGAGYYYRIYSVDTFRLSSRMHIATAADLSASGVKATLKPSLSIETFEGDWEKEWFTYQPEAWGRRTHKVHDGQWKAPRNATLAFEVQSAEPNVLVVGLDLYATELQLVGGSQWQSIALAPNDFQNMEGDNLLDWSRIKELSLSAQEDLRKRVDGEMVTKKFGGNWSGPDPEFRNLRWLRRGK